MPVAETICSPPTIGVPPDVFTHGPAGPVMVVPELHCPIPVHASAAWLVVAVVPDVNVVPSAAWLVLVLSTGAVRSSPDHSSTMIAPLPEETFRLVPDTTRAVCPPAQSRSTQIAPAIFAFPAFWIAAAAAKWSADPPSVTPDTDAAPAPLLVPIFTTRQLCAVVAGMVPDSALKTVVWTSVIAMGHAARLGLLADDEVGEYRR